MRTLMTCLLCLVCVGAAQAEVNLVTNGNFEDDLNDWDHWLGWGGWEECPDYVGRVSIGYDADTYPGIWQDTGATIQASRTYSMTVIGRAAPDAPGLRLRFEDAADDYALIKEEYFYFPEEDLGEGNGPWRTFTMSFDATEDIVGGELAVAVALVGEWWAHVANVTVTEEISIAAHDPTPADGAENVGISPDGQTVTVDLSWNTGLDPNNPDTYNPNILTHYLYMSLDQTVSNDANLLLIDSVPATGARDAATVTNLNFDGLYLWSVEEGIDDGTGSAYPAGDPNNIAGPLWSFSTLATLTITAQPESVLANTGDDVTFAVTADSIGEISYQWYKNGVSMGAAYQDAELTLSNVQIVDEASYYCEVSIADATKVSDVVTLGIRRQVAHWTLDAADYDAVNGLYLDQSGEGHDAAVGGTPVFVDGIVTGDKDPENFKTDGAVHFNEDNGWADAGVWNPAKFSSQFTISTWFKWEQTGDADFNVIVNKRDGWGFDDMMFMLHLHAPTERIIMETPGGGWIGGADNSVEPNQWYHLVAAYADADGSGSGPVQLYLNGELYVQIPSYTMGTGVDSTFWIARNENINERFGGILDDLQVYNYAFERTDVIDLYHAETGAEFCVDRPAWDLTGDCEVGLADFALLASSWLESGIYPINP